MVLSPRGTRPRERANLEFRCCGGEGGRRGHGRRTRRARRRWRAREWRCRRRRVSVAASDAHVVTTLDAPGAVERVTKRLQVVQTAPDTPPSLIDASSAAVFGSVFESMIQSDTLLGLCQMYAPRAADPTKVDGPAGGRRSDLSPVALFGHAREKYARFSSDRHKRISLQLLPPRTFNRRGAQDLVRA